MIKSFRNDFCGVLFRIQALEIFPGTCYKNNKMCPIVREKRLEGEDTG